VQIDGRFRTQAREFGQATRMVIVTVTEHNSVRALQVNPQTPRVGFERLALAGFEQDSPAIGLNPQRQPVLRQKAGLPCDVIDKNSDA